MAGSPHKRYSQILTCSVVPERVQAEPPNFQCAGGLAPKCMREWSLRRTGMKSPPTPDVYIRRENSFRASMAHSSPPSPLWYRGRFTRAVRLKSSVSTVEPVRIIAGRNDGLRPTVPLSVDGA